MTDRPLTAEETLAHLAAAAGAQGPLSTPDQADQHRHLLLTGDPETAATRLIDVARNRPEPPPSIAVTEDQLDQEITELLSVLGEQPPVRTLLVDGLADPATRLIALRALALLCDPVTAAPLASLATRHLGTAFLDEEELVQLASALGCVGGDEAVAAVQALRHRTWPQAVQRELDIAQEALEPFGG